MKLLLKLAILNIRRYPLRTLGSAVCLVIFGFALFSAVIFTRSLNITVSETLKSRSSGNNVYVKTDIEELDAISNDPDILEALPYYQAELVEGNIDIQGIGRFDIKLFYEQAPDIDSLIPKTYFEEFKALGGENFLVAGRMPEKSGEMIICESWLKKAQFKDYAEVLNKPVTLFNNLNDTGKSIIVAENIKFVGIFSEDFMKLNALDTYVRNDTGDVGFLINSESKYSFITTYCPIDKIDKVRERLSAKYGNDNVSKAVLTSRAIEKLSGLHLFVANLMYLAVGAIAFIYVMTRMVSTANYFKEKSLFISAADAFGCGKPRILGAFAAENILLVIPISAISAALSCTFVKAVFELISMYLGITLDITIDICSVFTAFAMMPIVELLTLAISLLLLRKKENN